MPNMRIRTLLLFMMVILLPALAAPAPQGQFAGVWKLDRSASQIPRFAPVYAAVKISLHATGVTLITQSKFQNQVEQQKLKYLPGWVTTNGVYGDVSKSRSAWTPAGLAILSVGRFGNLLTHTRELWQLSADGQRLTLDLTSQMGKFPVLHAVEVYTRQPASAWHAAPPPPPAAKAFRNIQVLKTLPANQLIPMMHLFAQSLGVECTFCHIQHHFDKDTKHKIRARQMLRMVAMINRTTFNNRQRVSCWTCHRGSAKPEGLPPLPHLPFSIPQPLPAHGK